MLISQFKPFKLTPALKLNETIHSSKQCNYVHFLALLYIQGLCYVYGCGLSQSESVNVHLMTVLRERISNLVEYVFVHSNLQNVFY